MHEKDGSSNIHLYHSQGWGGSNSDWRDDQLIDQIEDAYLKEYDEEQKENHVDDSVDAWFLQRHDQKESAADENPVLAEHSIEPATYNSDISEQWISKKK